MDCLQEERTAYKPYNWPPFAAIVRFISESIVTENISGHVSTGSGTRWKCDLIGTSVTAPEAVLGAHLQPWP